MAWPHQLDASYILHTALDGFIVRIMSNVSEYVKQRQSQALRSSLGKGL